MLRHLSPHNILNCEGTLITHHITDGEMEAHKASQCAQGHQARDSIRTQAEVHLTPEHMFFSCKDAKVLCKSNILGLFEY